MTHDWNPKEERHPGDGDFDVLRRQTGKYYDYILDLRAALLDVVEAVEAGDKRDDEDVGVIYTQIFNQAFVDKLKGLLERKG